LDARSDGTILTVRPGTPARPFGPKVGLELWRCATLGLGKNPFVNELYGQFWRHTHQDAELIPDRFSVQPRTSERGTS